MALSRKHILFRICCWKILITWRIGLAFAACQHLPDRFVTAPENSNANEGTWANFSCSPRNFDQDLDTITWQVAPSTEQKDSIQSGDVSGTVISTLMMKVNGRADFSIACRVVNSRSSFCYLSRAKLTVHYFPDESEFKCSPNESTDVREGDLLQINCNVTRSKPAVDLNWSFDEGGPPLPTLMPDNDGRVRFLTHSLPVAQGMHGKTITCVVTSDLAFKGRSLNCTIGPIKVLTPPQVAIHPANIVLQDKQHSLFYCEAYGYPDTFDFSWSCSPSKLLLGCNTTSQVANISLQCHNSQSSCVDLWNVTVSCTASSYAGNGTNSSTLFLEAKPDNTQPDNSGNSAVSCESVGFLTMTSHNKFIHNQHQAIIFCTVPSKTYKDYVDVQWYLDRVPLNGSNQRFFLEESPPLTFSLNIFNLSQSDISKVVTCEITSCNTKQRSSLVLSFNLDQSQLEQPPILDDSIAQHSQLPWWQMVIIASAGVVAAIALIACVVALLIKFIRRQPNPNKQVNNETPKRDHQGLDQSSVGSHRNSFNDQSYEVPTILFDMKPKALADQHPGEMQPYGLTHSYDLDDTLASTHSSSSLRSSLSGSSETSKGSRSSLSKEAENTLDTEPPYVNGRVIFMHSLKSQKSATPSMKRQQSDIVDPNNKPMPTIPHVENTSICKSSDKAQ